MSNFCHASWMVSTTLFSVKNTFSFPVVLLIWLYLQLFFFFSSQLFQALLDCSYLPVFFQSYRHFSWADTCRYSSVDPFKSSVVMFVLAFFLNWILVGFLNYVLLCDSSAFILANVFHCNFIDFYISPSFYFNHLDTKMRLAFHGNWQLRNVFKKNSQFSVNYSSVGRGTMLSTLNSLL